MSLGVIAKSFPLDRVRAVLASTGKASSRQRDLPAHTTGHRLNPTTDAARIEASQSDFYVNDGGVQLNKDEKRRRSASTDSVTKQPEEKSTEWASRKG